MCTASASVLVAVVPLLALRCTFRYIRMPNDTATAVTATANAQHGTLRLFSSSYTENLSSALFCWHLVLVTAQRCTGVLLFSAFDCDDPQLYKVSYTARNKADEWFSTSFSLLEQTAESISKVIFLLNASPFFLVILSGYLKDPAGASPYLQVHNLMNVYICKIVFNRGLTGVPRLFRIGPMGVSSVTWVTGQVVFCFVFFRSTVQFGSTVYRTQKFLFCENMWSCMLLDISFFKKKLNSWVLYNLLLHKSITCLALRLQIDTVLSGFVLVFLPTFL